MSLLQALREEQVWMATAYVELFAFISSIFQRIKRAFTALAKVEKSTYHHPSADTCCVYGPSPPHA